MERQSFMEEEVMPAYSFKHIKTGDIMILLCTWEEAYEVIKEGSYRYIDEQLETGRVQFA